MVLKIIYILAVAVFLFLNMSFKQSARFQRWLKRNKRFMEDSFVIWTFIIFTPDIAFNHWYIITILSIIVLGTLFLFRHYQDNQKLAHIKNK